MSYGYTGNTRRGFTPRQRQQILHRDPRCRCTGCPHCTPHGCDQPSTEADHITALEHGGTNDIDNGQGMCTRCHRWKTAREAHANRPRQNRPAERHPGLH